MSFSVLITNTWTNEKRIYPRPFPTSTLAEIKMKELNEKCASVNGIKHNSYQLMEIQKPFLDLTKEEQEDRNEHDLKEMALYYGGFDKLKEVIAVLEDNQNEAAWYRSQNDY